MESTWQRLCLSHLLQVELNYSTEQQNQAQESRLSSHIKTNWSLSAYQVTAGGRALSPATTKTFLLPLQISTGIDRRSWETWA